MGQGAAGAILEQIEGSTLVLAPALYSAEVASGLYKYVKAGSLSEEEALELYDIAMGLVDQLVGEQELAREAMAASIRHSHPVYDGLYGVLARRNGCPVLTLDRRLPAFLEKIQVHSLDLGKVP